MAFFNSLTVISTGTIFPSLINVLIKSASADPLARSARKQSPAEMWK
jgi:hypothetical protein